jgi:hypothetical protein
LAFLAAWGADLDSLVTAATSWSTSVSTYKHM